MKKTFLLLLILLQSSLLLAGETKIKEIYLSHDEGFSQIKLIFDQDFKMSPSFLMDDGFFA